MEKEKSFDVLELHKYKVVLSEKDPKTGKQKEIIISLPYVKTSAITAILFGSATEFKEIIKETISPEGIKFDMAMVKFNTITKALDLLNRGFMENLNQQLTDVVNIALDEYDSDGNKVKDGKCSMMAPEDIKAIVDVLLYDIGEVIKNVFGVETKKKALPKKSKDEKPEMTEEIANQEKELL
jgi:hypothetical protein